MALEEERRLVTEIPDEELTASGLRARLEGLREELAEQAELLHITREGWDSSRIEIENTLGLAAQRDCQRLMQALDSVQAPVGGRKTMMNLRQSVRTVVLGCFPELDTDAGRRSWTGTVLEHLESIRERVHATGRAVDALRARKPRGTLVLLAPEGFEGPRFLSQSFVAGDVGLGQRLSYGGYPASMTLTVPIEGLHWRLPPGGWIVAHGCRLSEVFVGNRSQTTSPDANFCQLSDEVALGVKLQVRVRFDGEVT